MYKTERKGRCIQCGNETNISLEVGKYACIDCLNEIGNSQKRIYNYLKEISENDDFKLFLYKISAILEVMLDNGCIKTEHCINAIKSFIITEDIDEESLNKIEKMLDKLT